MNTNTETKKRDTSTEETIDGVQTTELENVTGGCSNCGCGQPDQVAGGFASLFQRFQRA